MTTMGWRVALAIVAVMLVGLAAGIACAAGEPAEAAAAGEAGAGSVAEQPTGWWGSRIMWASLTMLFATFATSWAQSRIGLAGAAAMAEKPELSGTYIILIAIPETMVILGFVIAAMILTME